MKKLLLPLAAVMAAQPVFAQNISASGTQGYSCTVVGNNSISLVSTGQNQLTATGAGSIYQNGATDYTLSAVTATGPDANKQATVSAAGSTLSVSATTAGGATQQITGELSENVTYTVTVSSSDGILSAGNYSASADLTCTAAP